MSLTPIEPPTDKDTKHPAKFSVSIIDTISAVLDEHLPSGSTILDPFAGIGGIHVFGSEYQTYAVELEPEWAQQAARYGPTWCGDIFKFDPARSFVVVPHSWPLKFDAIVTSPTYGNRMADHHNARDGSKRITYKHTLGRDLTENNSGAMQWGPEYKMFHAFAWKRCVYVLLNYGGLFVLNIKDHVRGKRVMRVADWHRNRLEKLGLKLIEDIYTGTPGMRYGENGEARVDGEHVMVFRR